MKAFIAALMLSATLTAALAFGVGGDGAGDFGHMGSMPNAGTGGGPPPTCSNKLDFSQACNSQYLILGPLR